MPDVVLAFLPHFFLRFVERYLGTFPLDFEDPPKARYGYEHTPSLVGMADVFINNLGYVWNKKVRKHATAGRGGLCSGLSRDLRLWLADRSMSGFRNVYYKWFSRGN